MNSKYLVIENTKIRKHRIRLCKNSSYYILSFGEDTKDFDKKAIREKYNTN